MSSYSDRIFPWHVTVSFFNEDDNENPISTQIIDYDTEANPPYDEAYRPGYNTTWDKSIINITEDVDINAIYNPISYRVSFYELVSYYDQDINAYRDFWTERKEQWFFYEEFKPLLANSFIREGYTFDSWNTQQDGSGESYQDMEEVGNLSTEQGKEVSLYVQWEINKYNVTFEFYLENEIVYSSVQEIEYAKSAIDPREFDTEANKPGYFLILQNVWIMEYINSDITITGNYYPIEYWVELKNNYSQEDSSFFYIQYFTYDKPESLYSFYETRTGYTFKNWNTQQDGTDITYENMEEVSNLTTENGVTVVLYAQWEINKYNIDFEIIFKGETIHSSTQIVEYGEDAIDPRNEIDVNRDGYIFSWDSDLQNINIDKIIKGVYTPITYLVIYNSNVYPNSKIEEYFTYDGEQNINESIFTIEGYEFLSWNTAANGSGINYPSNYEGNLTTTNNEIINLYAQWNLFEYTVNFEIIFKGSTIHSSTQIVQHGLRATPPPRSSYIHYFYGYNFGWDNDYLNITSDLTISLEYTPINYRVCFFELTASQQMSYYYTYTFTYDEPNHLYPAPNKSGYRFTGWEFIGDDRIYPENHFAIFNFTTTENATVYLKASWEPIKYYISYNANTGSDSFTGSMSEQEFTFNVEGVLSPNTFHREGYIFNGWHDRSDWTKYEDEAIIKNLTTNNNETIVFYANWKAINYSVIFDPNSGTGEISSQSFTYNMTKALRTNSFVKTGYYFSEWNTERDASGESYQNSELIYKLTTIQDGEITLYAQWLPSEYTIDFDLNYPVGTSLDTITIKLGEIIPELPILERDGYIFNGWYTEEGQIITSGNEYSFDRDITLIANWNKIVTPFNFLIIYIVGGVATIIAVGITIPIVLRKKRLKKLSIGKKNDKIN